ncbi:amidohydrolase [Larkinella terrae]|uniref:Amidohydrolase n=1 Tax=Larkinella terrae TaxID=2025311 RepID=A0A7K0EDM8_9BACT|nr:amidohydrolase [Larkinella terrae]MRS59953.1 amidohydrolase [Larkinella terrae]
MPFEKSNPFVAFRRELHRFPEVSGQEFETQQRIKAFVSAFSPDQLSEVGKTGLLLQYGLDANGPVTLIRADIDALPIQEVNDFEHKSRTAGVSHKCGHDGHTAILSRLAAHLAEKPLRKGRVYLLFQPAEETGQGAEAVLNDPDFAAIRPDRVFALHNLPGFKPGTIVCKSGTFTSAVQSLIVTFTGKVSHSAEPEKGINPAYLMAEFTLKSRTLVNADSRSEDFALITPVYTTLGEKSYGISAGYGEVHLTLRTRTSPKMEHLTSQLLNILSILSARTGIEIETAITEVFFANQNHIDAFEQIKASAGKLGFEFLEKPEPFKWGEDFGLFTQHFKGAMFGIGAGENSPALHNDDYDFNDDLIEPAARLFRELIDIQHG